MVSGDPFQLMFHYDSVEMLKTNFYVLWTTVVVGIVLILIRM